MMPSAQSARFALLAAGLFGLTAVGLGAFGAHGLEASLSARGMTRAWETAARYHLVHSLALLGAAAWLRSNPGAAGRRMGWAAGCWALGIIVFSGSLYALALGGPRWLGPVTPFGGIALMLGWLLAALAGLGKDRAA